MPHGLAAGFLENRLPFTTFGDRRAAHQPIWRAMPVPLGCLHLDVERNRRSNGTFNALGLDLIVQIVNCNSVFHDPSGTSRAWRKDRSAACQSASVYPFAQARTPTKVHMISISWETSSSSSAYRSSSSSGLTMSLTCSYRSNIVGLLISRPDGVPCRLVDFANPVLVIPASVISAVAAAVRAGFRGAGLTPRRRDGFGMSSFSRSAQDCAGGSRDDGLGRQDQP